MQIDSQSEGHLEPSRSISLQYKQTLFHNRKHNYCFKCVRISRHHKSIFEIQQKNASGRNFNFYTIIQNIVRLPSSSL